MACRSSLEAQVNVVKDHGEYIDDQLKLGAHIRFIVSRAF
jgi:hypothetical protein